MKTFKKLATSVLILFSLIFFSSCSNNLSKDKAENLIIKKYSLPQTKTTTIKKSYYIKNRSEGTGLVPVGIFSGGSDYTYSNYEQLLKGYQANGLISINERKTYNNGISWFWADVSLTDKGKKYFISETKNEYVLKTYEISFGEIRDIQTQGKVATVNYTLKNINYSLFATDSTNATINRTETFSLYDDGWKITK